MKKILLLIMISLLASCATMSAQKREVSRAMVKLGMDKVAKNDLQGALIDFKKAEEVNKADPEIYYGLSLTYRQWGKPQLALDYVDKAIRYGDNLGFEHPGMKSEAYNLKGDILSSLKRYDEALENFKKALKDDYYTTPEFTLYNMAVIYMSQGRIDDAQTSLNNALTKNAHYAPAWLLVGKINFQKGLSAQAESAFKHAIEEFPDFTEAHWELALLYIKTENYKSAAEHLREVVRLDKEGPLGRRAQRTLNDMGAYGDS
jgi:tetratricopeptide (TPR) repeat protein